MNTRRLFCIPVEHGFIGVRFAGGARNIPMARVYRSVISVRNVIDSHANGTRGSNWLLLNCGHEFSQKGSIKIPKKVWCKDCESLKNGSISLAGLTKTYWDLETQLPKTIAITQEEYDAF